MSQANAQPAAVALDRKTFWIGVMAIIFAILAGLHAVRPGALASSAIAAEAVDGRDYQLVTAGMADGNEALYVLDKRTGLVAVMMWDNAQRRPVPVDIEALQTAFNR